MRRSRFSVEQIVAALEQAELGMPIAELARKLGIGEQTFYRWKRVYGSLEPVQARELKQLQEENAKLRRLCARSRARGCATAIEASTAWAA